MIVCAIALTTLHPRVFGVHIVDFEVVKGTEGLGRAAYPYINLTLNGQYPKGAMCMALIAQAL